MQCILIKVIKTKQFLSIKMRYPSWQDLTSKTIFYCKILTKQCGWVMLDVGKVLYC